MKTRVVYQTRLVLIACLIAFGLPGGSYAQGRDPDWVTSVAYSPDGDALASGSFNHIVRLWDATTGELRTTLRGHTNSVWDVAYSPDGSTLASASFDETVRLWDATTGEHLNTLRGHKGDIFSVSYSPSGDVLASASRDQTIRLWDATTGKHLNTLEGHTEAIAVVSYSPDGGSAGQWEFRSNGPSLGCGDG